MRPDISEQLDGICLVLETVITPDLKSDYSAEILRGLISNLRMLGKNWPEILPFLRWDNQVTAGLLASLRGQASALLRERIDAALAQTPEDGFDIVAAEKLNSALRGVLADCVTAAELSASLEPVTRHLAERAVRFPMRLSGATPKQAG